MLLADLVRTASSVSSTSSRTAKITLLAELLRKLAPDEIAPAVGFLAGEARQGRIGIGWATMYRIDVPPAAEPSLTIADVDEMLTTIQSTTGPGSAEARAAILRDVLTKATAAEADFVRRVLTGELRLGALEGIMTDAIARAANVAPDLTRRAAMLCGDLLRTAELALTGGEGSLGAVVLETLRPVKPMLASTAEDVATALGITGRASVEWKLDGIRIQVHRVGDDVRVYTRNLNDVTGRLPSIVAVARSLPVTAVVLDGEAIALDEAHRPHMFQDTMSRVGRHEGDEEALLVPWFFDCLHLDGQDLLDRPLVERLAALDRVAGPYRIPSTVTDDPEEAAAVERAALDAGHEGIVVKAADSLYQAGRRGKSWLKVKPVRSLDLVVIGVEWGSGRRSGWLSNLHLGARDPEGGFVMVGKTFKGLTDETLAWQTEQLLAREVHREGNIVFVRPELVVEIALDGVQSSRRYPGGVALRFARVRRYRPDKDPSDADPISAVRALLARGERA